MTEQQFSTLATLLGLREPDGTAAYRVIFGDGSGSVVATAIADQLRAADALIRAAYVTHGPNEFRITVGHRDTHRPPGALALTIGDTVRLTAHSTERWVTVRVIALPSSPFGYYRGVIVEQLVTGSRYAVGDGVEFSEDQVMIQAPRAASKMRRRRF
jgi:hypothetical protein